MNHEFNAPEAKPFSAARTLRPLVWWLVLVLLLGGYRQHQRRMENTRVVFSARLDSNYYFGGETATLDGKPVQSGQQISLGPHCLVIKHPMGQTFTTNFFGWYGGIDCGTIKLKRATGSLTVTSKPAARLLTIKGQEFSQTLNNSAGTDLVVPTGNYQIEVQDGGWSETRDCIVKPDTGTACNFNLLTGALALSSTLMPATFQLLDKDGQLIASGDLPALVGGIHDESYKVVFQHNQRRLNQNVMGCPGRTNEVVLAFPAGSMRFETSPADATVYASDGNALGTTPVTVNGLVAGRAIFRLVLNGYKPMLVRTTIRSNETNFFSTNLVSLAEVDTAHVVPETTAPVNNQSPVNQPAETHAASPDNSAGMTAQPPASDRHLVPATKAGQAQTQMIFDQDCRQHPDSRYFVGHEVQCGSRPAAEIMPSIVRNCEMFEPKFDVTTNEITADGIYELTLEQTIQNSQVNARREVLLVVGPGLNDQTTAFFKVIEYQWPQSVNLTLNQANGLTVNDGQTDWIPLSSSRIQMTPAYTAQIKTGERILLRRIKMATGQSADQ
jgi:PEGA domain